MSGATPADTLPSVPPVPQPSAVDVGELAQRVMAGGEITREEARRLFELEGEEVFDLLYWAHKVRRHFHGDKVTFCSIVASKFGECSEDCAWCAQSTHYGTGIEAHPMMEPEEVAKVARDAQANGASAFGIVNSGRGPTGHDWDKVLGAVQEMSKIEGMCRCASLGRLTDEQARELKQAGLLRYNHNLETSRRHFKNVVTTHSWEERVGTVRAAQRAGLETCCGGIMGMGETAEDRVDLAFTLKELNPNVVPLNFLNPIPGTPLAHREPLKPLEILKVIAAFRLILPHQDLKVAGGREKNLRDLQSWMYYAGATSSLIGNYLATFGRPHGEDLKMIEDLKLQWKARVGGPTPGSLSVINRYEHAAGTEGQEGKEPPGSDESERPQAESGRSDARLRQIRLPVIA